MTLDGAKNLTIGYISTLNLPKQIDFGGNNRIFYHYSAIGAKLLKHTVPAPGNGTGVLTHYIGNIVYEGNTLVYILTDEGRLIANGTGTDRKFLYEYNLKDHLGNSRVTFMGTDLGGSVDIVQTTSYYPFGLVMNQMNGNTAPAYKKNKYLYNGKELQDDKMTSEALNWFDYGARFYDPQIGRWNVVDPKSEEYFGWSPYNYVTNNPVKMIDPDGRSGEVTIDNKKKTVTVQARIIVYGSQANPELAKQFAEKLNSRWNSTGAKVTIGESKYSVNFNFTGEYREDGESLKNEIYNNTDSKNNYFRVENTTERSDGSSHVDEIGGNSGYINQVQNTASNNTTVPHEFGHLFGLNHPAGYDQRGLTPPNIMTTREQWGAPGYSDEQGYVNPAQREVTKGNINSIGLSQLRYDKTGKANLGYPTNTYYTPDAGYRLRK